MFSISQKRKIAAAVQKILKDTENNELPKGEIKFLLHVDGAKPISWANIRNNGMAGVHCNNGISDGGLDKNMSV